MLKVKIDFLLFCHDEQKFDVVGKEITERFDAKSFNLNLFDSDVSFTSSVTYNVEDNERQSRIISAYNSSYHPCELGRKWGSQGRRVFVGNNESTCNIDHKFQIRISFTQDSAYKKSH